MFIATRLLPAAFVLSLLVAVPAQAAQKPITGKLSKRGYTIVAIAANGKARAVTAKGQTFRVVPPAGTVTLHLRGADGVYAGPVVVKQNSSKKVVIGVKAGAKLGLVKVLKGYAKLKTKLAGRFVASNLTARASKGVPLGAGVFGRVRSSSSAALAGVGRDQDGDGLPGAFDVDDDGDLVLDNFERSAQRAQIRATIAQNQPPGGPQPPPPGAPQPPAGGAASQFRIFSNFKLDLEQSLNANASAVSDAQIDAAMSTAQTLAIQVASGDVELDCGGLSYCSAGGTGTTLEGGRRFPDDFDTDSDGFGALAVGPTGDFQLKTGATATAIGSGDAFVERVVTGGVETQLPGVLNYAFSTTPALTSWSAGGASGSITYPVLPGAPGTRANPITLSGAGEAIVTMTFWRPQRKAIAGSGEGTGWVDIGRLRYTADVPNAPRAESDPPGAGPGNCPGSTYTAASPNLTADSEGVLDGESDHPADPANTLTFSVNLSQCLASRGIAWTAGQVLQVDIQARSEFGDNAAQKISFVRGA